jgi:hypothetical protein
VAAILPKSWTPVQVDVRPRKNLPGNETFCPYLPLFQCN